MIRGMMSRDQGLVGQPAWLMFSVPYRRFWLSGSAAGWRITIMYYWAGMANTPGWGDAQFINMFNEGFIQALNQYSN